MLSYSVIRRLVCAPRLLSVRLLQSQSNAVNIEKIEAESATDDLQAVDEDMQVREAKLERSRNKSGLNVQHRNIINEQPPYSEPVHWSHSTLKYQRKLYGKYGKEGSQFEPALCWSKEELAAKREYESVAYPYTVQELMATARTKRQEKIEKIELRQAEILQKMQKSEIWKAELYQKIAKKEHVALAAKERKNKLIEEVRRHFGYTVDTRDERFKEMIVKKEKEQKKAMKDARKKEKEQLMMAKLSAKGKEAAEKSKKTKDTEQDGEETSSGN